MPYIGGKSQAGVYQRIISLIPPHRVYVEPFAGGFAIGRIKKPSEMTVAIDKDRRAIEAISGEVCRFCECGIAWLETRVWRGDEFTYCDPPYVLKSRGGRKYYRYEMSDDEHKRLLWALRSMTAQGVKVMLSGYPSDLYAENGFGTDPLFLLPGWSVETFQVMTRGHKWRTECLWYNYPRPTDLHDASHVGANRRERWNLERRRRTWRARFEKLSPLHRATLFSALVDVMGSGAAADALSRVTRSGNNAGE